MQNSSNNRRTFIKKASLASVGFVFAKEVAASFIPQNPAEAKKRIGIIGLDTSHAVAFTKALNAAKSDPQYKGYKIVAAYPKGSNDIQTSVERIPGYTEDVKKLGVEIVDSVEALLEKVDFVLLETNDGRLHLEQALKVIKSGKTMFIDKPVAASLKDAMIIFDEAKKNNVPVFSSSSLRFVAGAQEIAAGKVGKVYGAEAYSPLKMEKTHPDLFWYGIHGVETLYTLMGKGCKKVSRIIEPDNEMVIGVWEDNRIGTFRGIKTGKQQYGGTAFGEKDVATIGPFLGYNPLLVKIIEFFETGIPPVSAEETLEICAFMEAADESKKKGGKPVLLEKMFERAGRK